MVQEPPTATVNAILQRSRAARVRLSQDITSLRHRLDVPSRLKDSLRTHPTQWLGGGLAAGLLASIALKRPSAPTREKRKRSGIFGLALAAAGTIAKPFVKTWLTGKIRDTLAQQAHRPPNPPTPLG